MFEFLTKESRENVEKIIKREVEKAKADAEAKGKEEGKKAGFFETAKKLLKLGLSLDQISEATTLTKAEIQAIAM